MSEVDILKEVRLMKVMDLNREVSRQISVEGFQRVHEACLGKSHTAGIGIEE